MSPLRRTKGFDARVNRLIDPDHPCGPVAVALVSYLFGQPIGLERACQEIQTDPYGRCSLADLIACLSNHDFGATGIKANERSIGKIGKEAVLILYVNHSHFVVIKRNENGTLVVFDPPQPSMPLGELPYEWGGEAVLVTESPGHLERALVALGVPDHTSR
jgi:ABC-type bacteriocin/lantibiotic exporter with double-glycine peptidase domain